MIGFLFPLGLLALGLLAIPIILHLFRPKRVQETPFSSLRWLLMSQHRIKRHIRWHQILLLLLRIAFLAFLGFALAKPILSFERSGGTSDRFIIVDVGRHMGYRSGNEAAPLDVAFRLAGQLASHVLAGDRTTIILAGRTPVLLGPLVADATPYLQRMKAARPEPVDTDLAATLRLVRTLARPDDIHTRIDLFFITDNSVQDWAQGPVAAFLQGMQAPVRVQVIEAGAALLENAWIADARLVLASSRGARHLVVRLSASGTHQKRTLRVADLTGIPELRQAVDLQPGELTSVTFELPADYDLSGKIARLELTPGDALPADDIHWLTLDAQWAVQALVIEPDTTQVPELQPSFHLRTALEALAASSGGSPVVTRIPETAVLERPVEDADLVFLVDVPSLTDTALRLLERKVENGGTLVIFLGPSVNPDFYNTKMHDPVRPAGSLLPVVLKQRTGARSADGLDRITGVDEAHPLFTGLFDPLYGDFALARMTTYYLADPVLPDKDRVLARVAGDTPWLVERALGAGRVLFFNCSANDAWTDLPRRKSYVPFMDHLLRYTGGGVRRSSYGVGETAVIALPSAPDADTTLDVRSPGNQPVHAWFARAGEKSWAHVPDLPVPGPYHIRYAAHGNPVDIPFCVNAAAGSAWSRMEAKTLVAWWAPAEVLVIKPDARTGTIALGGTRFTLDPWFMFLACLAFLAEMFYTHRCCPRLNPSVMSESLVARRGFFAPTTPDEVQEGPRTP